MLLIPSSIDMKSSCICSLSLPLIQSIWNFWKILNLPKAMLTAHKILPHLYMTYVFGLCVCSTYLFNASICDRIRDDVTLLSLNWIQSVNRFLWENLKHFALLIIFDTLFKRWMSVNKERFLVPQIDENTWTFSQI